MLKFPAGTNHPLRLLYKNVLKFVINPKSKRTSHVAIDVLIPVAEKDLNTLPAVIYFARKNILNPINKIYIAGRAGVTEEICKNTGCIFINESDALPIDKSDIIYNGTEWFRSGWLFQQLIKLNADAITDSENVLVLDADTCLVKKQSFVLDDGSFILNFGDEYHSPYKSYTKLTQLKKRFFLSFVCHHMIFNKTILTCLKNDIELHTGQNWISAILSYMDYTDSSGFSEYELYGNYLYYNFRSKVKLEYWYNKPGSKFLPSIKDYSGYNGKYKSVSIHNYQ